MSERVAASEHLLIGLPATGKTTFLAALWHLVESAEIPGTLRLSKLEGDREYINELARKWQQCEPLPRTPVSSQSLVSMRLRDPEGAREIEVAIPDISGEAFRQQWTDRFWSRGFDKLVTGSSGALLFLHPNEIVEPFRIDQANLLVDAAGHASGRSEEGAKETVAWSHELAPTQVILTDVLQFMHYRRGPGRPMKVAIMISAWDLVESEGKTPQNWCEARLPLLLQFLQSNPQFWATRYYGVSAQGGDLDQHRDTLLRHVPASKRVRITGPDAAEHDLTAPLRWLFD